MNHTYDWQGRCWRRDPHPVVKAAIALHAVLPPARAIAAVGFATDPTGFAHVLDAALRISDWLCVGVIMYAGGCWMFGDRTKAMERLIGAAVGYLIIRKAKIIQEFLGGL